MNFNPDQKPYTGGDLNWLNGKYGVSAPENSVSVMKLIRVHQPKTRRALAECIEDHFRRKCECGIESQGTVEEFGKVLYACQKIEWGEERYTLQECIQWEFDLFVTQSLKGEYFEKKAIVLLGKKNPALRFSEARGYLDEEARIDILVAKKETIVTGIQIKPVSFHQVRENVVAYNKTANQKVDYPVLYLYYDDQGIFSNLDEISNQLEKLCAKS